MLFYTREVQNHSEDNHLWEEIGGDLEEHPVNQLVFSLGPEYTGLLVNAYSETIRRAVAQAKLPGPRETTDGTSS